MLQLLYAVLSSILQKETTGTPADSTTSSGVIGGHMVPP